MSLKKRVRFKIKYSQDHKDPEKAGQYYRAPDKMMVVMNSQGVFFLVDLSDFYTHVTKLSDVLHQYDVEWL